MADSAGATAVRSWPYISFRDAPRPAAPLVAVFPKIALLFGKTGRSADAVLLQCGLPSQTLHFAALRTRACAVTATGAIRARTATGNVPMRVGRFAAFILF